MDRIGKLFIVALVSSVLTAATFSVSAHDHRDRYHERESSGLSKRYHRDRHRDRHERRSLRRDHRWKHRDLYRHDYRHRYWIYPRRPYSRYYWYRNGDDDLLWFGLGFALPYLLDDRFDD
ncbi:MAG: hypothetical protein ABW082_14010 [Sedimenticola sp.]